LLPSQAIIHVDVVYQRTTTYAPADAQLEDTYQMEKSINRSDWNANGSTKAETAVGDTSSRALIQSTI
jgi:hypothetical protein